METASHSLWRPSLHNLEKGALAAHHSLMKVHGWLVKQNPDWGSVPTCPGCPCLQYIALPFTEALNGDIQVLSTKICSRFTFHFREQCFSLRSQTWLHPNFTMRSFCPLAFNVFHLLMVSCQLGGCRLGERSRNKLICKFNHP